MPDPVHDVIVVGGGNAALCAALQACRDGASVLLLEAAPGHLRGGNSRHTRALRHLHKGPINYLVGSYEEDEYYADLLQVTGGDLNEDLARMTIRGSEDLGEWVITNGGRWQRPFAGLAHLSRTDSFFMGGGKGLVNAYYRTAAKLGVEICYEAEVTDIVPDGAARVEVEVQRNGATDRLPAKAVVVASGGFEANLEWWSRQWGEEAAHNFLFRGTPYNRGWPVQALLGRGAAAIGNPREFLSGPLDARGPQFDGGSVTRIDTVPFGIVVNRDGRRFSDEGADYWSQRSAPWGVLIARQPGQIVYSLLDAQMINDFMPPLYPPYKADSIRELALQLGLEPETVCATVEAFNAAVRPGTYDANILDDCYTEGLDPPKSHWARALDKPPFYAYPMKTGIFFAYYSLRVNEHVQVLAENGEPIPGVYAAGEAMIRNIFGRGYMSGLGMMIGSVSGRIAGRKAAALARA